jgi:hypothetical protein
VRGQRWPTDRFRQLLTVATEKVWCHPVHPCWYRQISIAVAQKHVQGAEAFVNRLDDTTPQADPDVAFAWQSGQRPLQRGQTYGLDGAFPTKLQPALLHVYSQVSSKWHRFLNLGGTGTFTRVHSLPETTTTSGPSHHPSTGEMPIWTSTPGLKRKRQDQVSHAGPGPKKKKTPRTKLDPAHPREQPPLSLSPNFLQPLPDWRVILCTTHRCCYTRQNIARHLLEKHKLMRNQRLFIENGQFQAMA